ncbi:MAG: DUF2459 domain-containing protein, partial [Halocynthiibacter sp.]
MSARFIINRVLALLLCFALFIASALFLGVMVPGAVAPVRDAPKPHEIQLLAGPIHYDFMLPINEITKTQFSFAVDQGLELSHPDAKWLVVGWGAHGFYTARGDVTNMPTRTLKNAILGDRSVIHLDLAATIPDDAEPIRINLTEEQFQLLNLRVISQITSETPIKHAGFNAFDQFYTARDEFHIARTCNTWVSRTLREIGIPMGIWTPLKHSVS